RQRRHRAPGDAAQRAALVLGDGVAGAADLRDGALVRHVREERGAARGGGRTGAGLAGRAVAGEGRREMPVFFRLGKPVSGLRRRSGRPGDDSMSDTTIERFGGSGVLPASLPFPEGTALGRLVFLSGQLGNVPGTLTLVPGGLRAEARQA